MPHDTHNRLLTASPGILPLFLLVILPSGAEQYRAVFRLTGCTAFVGYALAHMQRSISYSQPWNTTAKNMFDGLIYGLLTGGTFGWLWPDV